MESERQIVLNRQQFIPSRSPRFVAVYASRPLGLGASIISGYAKHGVQDVRFVDIRTDRSANRNAFARTLVIQMSDGHWYAHPMPEAYPLLDMGLNEESASIITFEATS